jgi:hypothetical protein
MYAMFDLRDYFKNYNEPAQERYENSLKEISDIQRHIKISTKSTNYKKYTDYLSKIGRLIIDADSREKTYDDSYISKHSFEELLAANNKDYNEIFAKNYESASYANPAYCVDIFGEGFGQLMSYLYCQYRRYPMYATYHQIYEMEKYNRVFIEAATYLMEHDTPDYDALRNTVTRPQLEERADDIILELNMRYSTDFGYLRDIVETADLADLRYLFKYGRYVSENEIKMVQLLQEYPQQKVKDIAQHIAHSYIAGFKRENKDLGSKSTVGVYFSMGYEAIMRELIRVLRERGLEAVVLRVSTSEINEQYRYDHRFDNALYLNEMYCEHFQKEYADAYEACKNMLTEWSGLIAIDTFGRKPFTPKNKNETLRLSPEQQKLYQELASTLGQIRNRYIPQQETSFTLISFPSPEIGNKFKTIFSDIVDINTLDSQHYEHIQQKIIDVLDMADYVHIKGNNRTDIKIKMHDIADPRKQTNFVNCGADINIPVGEVFTTPLLKGTNGVLHIEETYLRGLKYRNLELTFKDGYVIDYNCSNFSDEKENKKFIEENLLFPHKTLPVGEFAIGTNTLAYVIAKKYDILHLLPILIIEKMGPHFALGDSCFALEEDVPAYNMLNSKEIIARENEKSALRKKNIKEAYVFRHIDITIPYESIAFISAVTRTGQRIDVIKDGRFVVGGSEDLNRPFKT